MLFSSCICQSEPGSTPKFAVQQPPCDLEALSSVSPRYVQSESILITDANTLSTMRGDPLTLVDDAMERELSRIQAGNAEAGDMDAQHTKAGATGDPEAYQPNSKRSSSEGIVIGDSGRTANQSKKRPGDSEASEEVQLEGDPSEGDGDTTSRDEPGESLETQHKAKLVSLVIDDLGDAPIILDPQFMARLNILNLQTELAQVQSDVMEGSSKLSQRSLKLPKAASLDLRRLENILHRYSKLYSHRCG